ncbi:hypothetical protein QO010_001988 [Caulobacter ginsengisoli]|uniref:DUF4440 domain-containing protein n=1 Tax=Caulobacter ginsengisoli TaxID=400775 RepID=A0ABU0ITA8_9CAUL|nr:DUF4440 domain-containing protein [Caulobacter ginsengisoli]MDQ0464207.1 hypothetical protein [Caulobacter ginsengisoli]
MRRLLVLLLLVLATPVLGEPRWAGPGARQYWPLKAERIEAYRTGDRAYFEALLADDFVALGPDGRRVGRADYLAAEFGTGQRQALGTRTEVVDFAATRTGDTLVLAYEEMEVTTVGTGRFVTHLQRLDVYVLRQGRWRLQTMSGVRIPEAPAAMALRPEQLADYVGEYAFGPGLVSTVRLQDGRLVEQTTGQAAAPLVPVGPDLFYSPGDLEARVQFERDPAGRVVAQIYRSGSQVLRGPRAN